MDVDIGLLLLSRWFTPHHRHNQTCQLQVQHGRVRLKCGFLHFLVHHIRIHPVNRLLTVDLRLNALSVLSIHSP